MSDMADIITGFLEDEKNVELLKSFAGFMKEDGDKPKPKAEPVQDGLPLNALAALSKLGGGEDDRVRLIKALRPFVSERRREGLDSMAKILRLSQLLTLLGDDIKF